MLSKDNVWGCAFLKDGRCKQRHQIGIVEQIEVEYPLREGLDISKFTHNDLWTKTTIAAREKRENIPSWGTCLNGEDFEKMEGHFSDINLGYYFYGKILSTIVSE